VQEVVPPTAGVVEPVDDRRCRMVAGSPSLEQLAVWIALLGSDFDIEEPAKLHNVIGPIAARLHRASPADGDSSATPR
jgi:hypothetical protein